MAGEFSDGARPDRRLNTQRVAAPGASPDPWLGVLHGIYGAGRNWRAVARDIVARRPDWGALLIDMREHGGSRGFEPPHTLERTAGDLEHLASPNGVRALLGHSFGGKIALLRAARDLAIKQLWIVDSTPEAREPAGSAWHMLEAIRRMPSAFPDRDAAVSALADEGFPRPVGLWMSTNLVRRAGRYEWGLDLEAMESLLRDFFRVDLWSVVEAPRDGLEIHFIRATESPVLDLAEVDRLRAAGIDTGRVFVHDLEGGHWLNADNPDGLVELIAPRLLHGVD